MQLVATVMLARLLTPKDYGLIAMVTVITQFVALFNEPALSSATVQNPRINHNQVSTLFWISLALGCVLTLLTAALAPFLAWLYGEPRLTWITVALATGFVFAGLGRQHHALLRRQMRYVPLASIEFMSLLLGVSAAIISAWYGAQYWSLVVLNLVMHMANALGLWIATDWRPGRPVRHSGVRSMLAFGGHITGFHILNYLALNSGNLLIGWYWGAHQLGLYAKAYHLFLPLLQFRKPVGNVAVPVLSRLQDNPDRYRAYYDKSVLLSTTFMMPLVAFLFVTADTVIPLVLGAQWKDAIPIFQALAPGVFVQSFTSGIWWICVSLGETRREFHWSIGMAITGVLSFLLGVRWGATGAAIAFSTWQAVVAIPTLIYCCKHSPLLWTAVAKTVSRPALAAATAAFVLATADRWLLDIAHPIFDLATSCFLYVLLYIAVWMALPDGRRILSEIPQLLSVLWRKQEKAKAVSVEENEVPYVRDATLP
jgi:O-antigen/teichoic acid export membrane protein